jgi:hypothetical protein
MKNIEQAVREIYGQNYEMLPGYGDPLNMWTFQRAGGGFLMLSDAGVRAALRKTGRE